MTAVPRIEQNLSLLERMLEEFESFILSDEIFWPISQKEIKGVPLPRLTLGGLLLILDELTVLNPQMNSKQVVRYDRLLRKYEGTLEKWRSTIENKAIQELHARLNLWRAYLQDLEDQSEWIEDYSREVRIRVMMSRLIDFIGQHHNLESEMQSIRGLDDQIRGWLAPGQFIWETSLQSIYPQDKFPFLYTKPHKSLTR